MAKKNAPVLTLGGASGPERPLVEVFGHEYRVRSVTKSVQAKLQRAQVLLNAFVKKDDDDADTTEMVVGFGDAFSALLEPTNGAPDAKALVLEKWDADELSVGLLRPFFDAIQEKSVEADRPPTA